MSPALPARASLEHLKKQAKELLHSAEAQDATATERFRALGIASGDAKLADAQHVIAREYGFSTWADLKEHVESLEAEENPRQALIAAAQAGDVTKARTLLQRHAKLRAQIKDPWPEIPFGGRPIGAAAQHSSKELVDLLLEFGADINARSDWWAGSFGVLDSGDADFAQFLISRGARVDAHSAARLGMLDKLREIVSDDPSVVHARGDADCSHLQLTSAPINDDMDAAIAEWSSAARKS